jgi:hypothetical protein
MGPPWQFAQGPTSEALGLCFPDQPIGVAVDRKVDSYSPQTVWYKVKNPAYTQAEGRGDLFHKLR